ncbi:MAG: hypothetical protein LKM41_08145 [Lachnospiraceae bacterium]|jgi:hypothetical protein|nr:hypothetical protein [Lachnospiraceae bacterium]
MPKIVISQNRIAPILDKQMRAADQLASISEEVAGIGDRLPFKIAESEAILSGIRAVSEDIQAQNENTRSMHSSLSRILEFYRQTEAGVLERLSGVKGSRDGQDGRTGGNGQNDGNISSENQKSFDGSFHAGAEAEADAWKKSIAGEYGSASVAVSAAAAYAKADGQLWKYDENGIPVIDPRIDAKAGASYSVLEAKGEAHVGDENLGAGASGDVKVLSASAEAGAKAEVFDENGNFAPSAEASAGAKAVAAEATGEVHADLAGAEASAEGSAMVGFAAEAGASISEGKVSAHVAVAAGVGLSLTITLDFTGMIAAAKKGCRSLLFG